MLRMSGVPVESPKEEQPTQTQEPQPAEEPFPESTPPDTGEAVNPLDNQE